MSLEIEAKLSNVSKTCNSQDRYLLQHRALEVFKTFVRVPADIPSDWPRTKASDTPSMLTANAKLLQIFAA